MQEEPKILKTEEIAPEIPPAPQSERPLIKTPFFIALLMFLVMFLTFPAALRAAGAENVAPEDILNAAESVFRNMQTNDHVALWHGLSVATQRNIIRKVGKAMDKARQAYTEELVRKDFETGGEVARGYWSGYLAQFDPKIILEECQWKMGVVKKDKAEIIIRYRKSENDAILKLFREGGVWKVGLDETFSTRTK